MAEHMADFCLGARGQISYNTNGLAISHSPSAASFENRLGFMNATLDKGGVFAKNSVQESAIGIISYFVCTSQQSVRIVNKAPG